MHCPVELDNLLITMPLMYLIEDLLVDSIVIHIMLILLNMTIGIFFIVEGYHLLVKSKKRKENNLFNIPNMEKIMAKILSCGILHTLNRHMLLLCHATGQIHWDIPKGVLEPNENERQTALREYWEEVGYDLSNKPLINLGRHKYLKRKDLHLFWYDGHENIDLLTCRSSDREVDGYWWVAYSGVHKYVIPRLDIVLEPLFSNMK
jgi:8-oxo-dGTP pyrophosphatase MutT (NUDIX family)